MRLVLKVEIRGRVLRKHRRLSRVSLEEIDIIEGTILTSATIVGVYVDGWEARGKCAVLLLRTRGVSGLALGE